MPSATGSRDVGSLPFLRRQPPLSPLHGARYDDLLLRRVRGPGDSRLRRHSRFCPTDESTARRPKQNNELSFVRIKGDGAQCRRFNFSHDVSLSDMADMKHRFHRVRRGGVMMRRPDVGPAQPMPLVSMMPFRAPWRLCTESPSKVTCTTHRFPEPQEEGSKRMNHW